jgi:hypothetical protein
MDFVKCNSLLPFLKNAVIYAFLLVCFFYLVFFSRAFFQAIARPIYTKFGTNVSSSVVFRMQFRDLEKVKKTRSRRAKKHRKINEISRGAFTFSLRTFWFSQSFNVQRMQSNFAYCSAPPIAGLPPIVGAEIKIK